MLKSNTQFEILTPSGFQHFDGISQISREQSIQIQFSDESTLNCSLDHPLIDFNGEAILAKYIKPKHKFIINKCIHRVVKVMLIEKVDNFYDPINVTNGNVYISNNVISHNCEFLSSDPMLIDTIVVANLQTAVKKIKPIGTIGEITFYKQPQSGTTYMVGMDVATGTGKDFTTLEVFEFPSLDHVAEWRSNTTSSPVAYQTLTRLLRILERTHSTVFFSVENNGVGEGIIALYEADENPPMASEFISEEGANRSGMTTTGKSKMRACLTFKELVERGTIHISSPLLIEEMKHFVRKGGTYDHKVNATSDLIMASLIVMRILENVSSFDGEAYDLLYSAAYQGARSEDGEYDDDDDVVEFLI